jgi:protein ImuA
MSAANADIIRQLQRDILPLQGFKPPTAGKAVEFQLGPIEAAFPNCRFPTGAVHEFISSTPEQSAVTNGFLSGLLAPLLKNGGACLWIGSARTLFPPGLAGYGVSPDRLLFLDVAREKDRCWAMEEALKCEALAAVVGEISEIGFTDSRRLQLAVEQSRVTGFLLRQDGRNASTVASVARWEISPLPSEPEEGLPGIGFPRWQATLHKVRNGRPGSWVVEWSAGRFRFPAEAAVSQTPGVAASLLLPAIRTPHKRRTG